MWPFKKKKKEDIDRPDHCPSLDCRSHALWQSSSSMKKIEDDGWICRYCGLRLEMPKKEEKKEEHPAIAKYHKDNKDKRLEKQRKEKLEQHFTAGRRLIAIENRLDYIESRLPKKKKGR